MGPNWKEQGKHCKKPAEHTAGSQQNTPVLPESFPDVNFSCHSPWSILRMTGRTTFQYQLPSFLNDCTIFQSIWRLQEKNLHLKTQATRTLAEAACLWTRERRSDQLFQFSHKSHFVTSSQWKYPFQFFKDLSNLHQAT